MRLMPLLRRLVVVGNPFMLQRDDRWRKLLEFALSHQAYDGVPFDLEAANNVDADEQSDEWWKELNAAYNAQAGYERDVQWRDMA